MALWVKGTVCRYERQSLDSGNPQERQSLWHTAITPVWGCGDRRMPELIRPLKPVSSRFSEKAVSENKVEGDKGRHLWSQPSIGNGTAHRCAHRCAHVRMHIRTYLHPQHIHLPLPHEVGEVKGLPGFFSKKKKEYWNPACHVHQRQIYTQANATIPSSCPHCLILCSETQ